MTNLIIDASEKFIHKKLKKIYFFSKVVYYSPVLLGRNTLENGKENDN